MRAPLIVLVSLALVAPALVAIQPAPPSSSPCKDAGENPLPLPSTVAPERLADYERQVLAFLRSGAYVQLGWCGDKAVRDTGPLIATISYGTHKAVRVFYSPGVMRWLIDGRTRDAADRFTTSFLRRDHEVKDNRILPAGWSPAGPDPALNGTFLEATFPKGEAARDPDFRDGKGSDTVRYRIRLAPDVNMSNVGVQARLFYQSIPPSYLSDRFKGARGDATRRLYYLTSTVNLAATPMAGWKIAIAETSATVVR